MAYADLIKEIFGEEIDVISENEFLAILSDLLFKQRSSKAKWSGEMRAMIIVARFGLCGHRQLTLKECGADFGVGPERIRQIEAQSLRQLRHHTNVSRYVTCSLTYD